MSGKGEQPPARSRRARGDRRPWAHGQPEGGEALCGVFAGLGLAAFALGLAGGCELGGKSDGRTDGMSALAEADDLCAVLDRVRRLPYVDGSRVFSMGCGQGGSASAPVAAKGPTGVAGLAMSCPAPCVPDGARRGKTLLARFDPPKDIGACAGPVPMARGAKDEAVAARHDEEAYRRRGERCGSADGRRRRARLCWRMR